MMVFSKIWRFLKDNLGQFASRPGLWGLFLFAIVLRMIYLSMMVGQVSAEELMTLAPDTIRYVGLGQELLNWRIMDEAAVLIFGPGYGALLGAVFFVSGVKPIGVLLTQILLSSLGCLIVYRLGKEITGSKGVGYIAGFLTAMSFTSISLANFILSDTLFFFLFLWGNLAFLLGLKNEKRSYYIWSGFCIGLAILTRSIGQFWPLVMVGLIFVIPLDRITRWSFKNRLRLLRTAGLAPLVAIALMSVWMARNYHHHSIPMLAFTSAGGPANVARLTLAKVENRDPAEIDAEWKIQYAEEMGVNELSFVELYRMYNSVSRQVFAEYPQEMITTYLDLVWENLNAVNELYRVQLPRFTFEILDFMWWMQERSLHFLSFWFSMGGLVVLMIFRKWKAALFLGLLYLYFVLMLGFTQWQGSRLFYPGQIASSILTAYLIFAFGRIFGRAAGYGDSHGPRRYQKIEALRAYLDSGGVMLKRYYFLVYCLIILGGLFILYHSFLPEGRMLNSNDMIYGVSSRLFLIENIARHGSVPMWNPYILCGLPYVAAIHGDIFYPLSFLKFLIPVPKAISWTLVIHIFLAGVFAYAAARQLSLSRLGATVVGLAYTFSGWLNSLILPGHDSKIYVTALFPLVILFMHRAYIKRAFFNLTIVGVVLGAIILSPHPQMAYLVIWAILGYGLFKMIGHLPSDQRLAFLTKRSALIGYAIILGIALAAIQFLPAFEYTNSESRRTVFSDDYIFAASWSLHEEEVVSLLIPEFVGAIIPAGDSAYWGRNSMKDNSEYAGLAALILAVLGAFYYRGREKYFFIFLGFFSLVFALGDTTPLYKYFYKYVPMVRMMRAPSMIMFMFSFAVAMLAGMGTDALKEKSRSFEVKKDVVLKVLLIGLPLIFLIGLYLFLQAGEEMLRLYARLFYSDLIDDPVKMSAARDNLGNLQSGLVMAFVLSSLLSSVILMSRYRRVGAAVLVMLPVLVMADGIRFDRRFIDTIDYKKEFQIDPMVKFIAENAGFQRAFGFALDECAYHPEISGVFSLAGYHGNEMARYYRLFNHGRGIANNFINPRFVGLVGARYIMMPIRSTLSEVGYAEDSFREAREFEGVKVTEYLDYFPRAYLVGSYRVIESSDSIFTLIYDGPDDLRRMVYLDREPPLPIDSAVQAGDTAVIEYYSPDSVVIRTRCTSAKILTLSDNYYRDWHVYVDGRKSEALLTYGTFRGVAVEGGEHLVVWRSQSSTYKTGKAITLAATGYIFIVLAGGLIFRRRTGRRPALRL